jgi:hypothetical protein
MQSYFQFKRFIPWWLSGVSLFIVSLSFSQGQLYFEVLRAGGWAGMWIFWSNILGSFIIPLLFARLWQKLQLPNDNHFYLIRFPGTGGKVLYHFRRIYVGILITSFLIAFNLITYSNLLAPQIQWNYSDTLLITGGGMLILMLLNTLDFQVKWDLAVFALYLILVVMIAGFVWLNPFNGHTNIQWSDLFPASKMGWHHWFYYIGFQWWATQQMDGGSFETSRYKGVSRESAAQRSALVAAVGSLISSLVVAITAFILVDLGFDSYWSGLLQCIPKSLHLLIWIIITGMMVAQVLAFSNWGAAMVADVHQNNKWVSRTTLIFIIAIGITIAWQSQELLPLSHYVFAISAGVAPFYILRWFFPSLGPWTQITVMLTSLLGTLLYPYCTPGAYSILDLRVEETRTLLIGTITLISGLLSWWIFPRCQPTELWMNIRPSGKWWIKNGFQSLILGIAALMTLLILLVILF